MGATEIERGRVNLGQLDPVTFKQLSTRKSEWSENGKLKVESKDKMRAEGRRLPDRGDAVLGCIAFGARMSGAMSSQDLAEVSPCQRHDGGFATPLVTGWWESGALPSRLALIPYGRPRPERGENGFEGTVKALATGYGRRRGR